MSEETNNAGELPSSRPQKKSKTVLLIVVLLVVLATAGNAWFFLHRSQPAEASAAADTNAAPKYTLHLESFTANLADPGETHFLRITMDLGLDNAPTVEKEGSGITFPMARVRDAIISILTVSQADPLLTPEGKAKLKRDLLQALQQKVPELGIRDIYFTEFLVQR
jgi:flagellar FliL protein